LVYSNYDSTEEAIQKMIEASQRMISEQNNPIINKHFELQIKTHLQNALRDAGKLERLLRAKERRKEEAMYIDDQQATNKQLIKDRLSMESCVFH
jgi:hypothetical protein